jgi:hypothetical protein
VDHARSWRSQGHRSGNTYIVYNKSFKPINFIDWSESEGPMLWTQFWAKKGVFLKTNVIIHFWQKLHNSILSNDAIFGAYL